jgi:hypothetical protein
MGMMSTLAIAADGGVVAGCGHASVDWSCGSPSCRNQWCHGWQVAMSLEDQMSGLNTVVVHLSFDRRIVRLIPIALLSILILTTVTHWPAGGPSGSIFLFVIVIVLVTRYF